MGRTRLTVVVPCLNRVRFVGGTIDSIVAQNRDDVECIVMDGGSTDGTLSVLESFGDRVRVISGRDGGAADAINKGWRLGCGDLLAWLNADDVWAPGAAATAIEYLDQHPEVDIAYGDCGGIDEQDRLVWFEAAQEWSLRKSVETCHTLINQAGAFMRRSILERIGWLYADWCHDHDLWVRAALAGGRFGRVPAHLANVRIWAGNASSDPDLLLRAKIRMLDRLFATPGLPPEVARLEARARSNAHVRCLYHLVLTRPAHWRIAPRLVARAVAEDRSNAPGVAAAVARITALSARGAARRLARARP